MVNDQPWPEFRRVSERGSADALVLLLAGNGVAARIEAPQLLPGVEGYFVVRVEPALLHRARWLVPEDQFTDSELRFLSTGELGTADD